LMLMPSSFANHASLVVAILSRKLVIPLILNQADLVMEQNG